MKSSTNSLNRALPLALLLALSPALVWAQAAPPKPLAKPAARAATKVAPQAVVEAARKPRLTSARQKAIEESTPVDDDPAVKLSAADLEVAKQVHVGDIPCELGATVHVTRHKREGFFIVRTGIQRFRMHPVESRTGAIRLEDPVAGAMWLQLGNKSMLMSQKIGKRLADECMNPVQAAMNETLKKNPIPSLLEPLPVAKVPAAEPSTLPSTPPTSEAQEPPPKPPADAAAAPAPATPAAAMPATPAVEAPAAPASAPN